jgi:glutathione peroxidase
MGNQGWVERGDIVQRCAATGGVHCGRGACRNRLAFSNPYRLTRCNTAESVDIPPATTHSEAAMTALTNIPLKKIDGSSATLADYRGKVLLVVNVASKCGLTPQYTGLEKLYQDKHANGLEVLGFPANDFRGQEPGSNEEIASFCSTNYDVHFPLFSKISVLGADKHPLYAQLTVAQPKTIGEGAMRERLKGYGIETSKEPDVVWNFEKFLLSRKGEVVARFAPDMTVDDPRIVAAIDAELNKTS